MGIFSGFRKKEKSIGQLDEAIRTLERRNKERDTFKTKTKKLRELQRKESGFFQGLEKVKGTAKTISKNIEKNSKPPKSGGLKLGSGSNPFSTEMSRPSFGTARNVIYGDPEPKKPKKRTVKLTFED